LNPVEVALVVTAGAVLTFFFVSAPICLIMITRRLAALGVANQALNNKLQSLKGSFDQRAEPQLKAIAQLQETLTNAVSQTGGSAQHQLTKISEALSSYGPLLIRINDFYAVVQHFEARIKDGAMMANDLAKAISGLQEIIKEGGRAAADVNGVMAEMRRAQNALADSHKEMLKTLQQQQEALEKILGAVKVRVAVEVDSTLTYALNNVAAELNTAAKVISALEAPLNILNRPKPPRSMLARIFSPD
jgi:DNA repair ATPase RecN